MEQQDIKAKARHISISAQKTRLVVDLVRGKDVVEALEVLNFTPNKAALPVSDLVTSAIANAEHNEGLDIDELHISSIYVDEGTTLKRIRPRAKGRADRILKRSCHITVKVADKE